MDIRNEVRELLDDKINDVFFAMQEKLGIADGNIDPWAANQIDELEDRIADLIASVLDYEMVFDADDGVDEACEDGKCEKCDEPLKEEDKDGFVIYKEMDEYCVTPRSNYGGYTQNARKVHRMKDFTSAREVMDYWNKYFHTTDADFEVIDEEKCEEAKCEEGKKCCPKIVDKKEVTEESKERKLTEDRSGEHTIWSNDTDTIDALADDIIANPDEFGYDGDEDEPIDVDWARDLAYDLNNEYLGDERFNLDIDTNDIIAIGDIGRWNGRVKGYKEIGRNIADCLYSDCDYVTWYVDRDDFKCHEIHHDGENYITYRERKNDIEWEDWDDFLDMLYRGTATQEDVDKYTNSLRPQIAQVYGW